MTFGSLFAGIGGMDLGLERAGMECRWQVEIDPFCRKVLAKHWPDIPRHDDVRTFPDGDLDRWRVDLIAGGFPCQDVSEAGRREGIEGARSGLWAEYKRVVRVLRPGFVLVENVPGLLSRGMGRVLGDLAAIGYDAEWESVPASAAGAPHIRDRVFILAHTRCGQPESPGASRDLDSQAIEDAISLGERKRFRDAPVDRGQVIPALRRPGPQTSDRRSELRDEIRGVGLSHWGAEPGMGRVVDGISAGLDEPRLKVLGNAVVPQVAHWIGRRIMASLPG